jgi:hypothetical protein
MGKWTTPLGIKTELVNLNVNASPHALIEALLDATIRRHDCDFEGYSRWQADQLEMLANRIRESQDQS